MGCQKLSERFLEILENPDDMLQALPPDKALNAARILLTAIQGINKLSDKLDINTEKNTKIIPRLIIEE